MYKHFVTAATFLAAAIVAAEAQAFEFGKPITTPVVITKHSEKKTLLGNAGKKQVTLMNIMLTPHESHKLFSYRSLPQKSISNLPPSINLGMNNVPVLDQGQHGTCVTFAVTAALDAILGQGDYISQLCHLELGQALMHKGYLPDGWWGSLGPWVIDQITRFGIVNKTKQKELTCGTLNEYPIDDFSVQGEAMSLGEFKRMSEGVVNIFYPTYYMSFIDRFAKKFEANGEPEKALKQIKESLVRGNRVAIGTFLVLSPYCSAGACATYRATQDTWALTKEIELPPYGTGGHEMVIFGYDDAAYAVDQQGKKHQGLLMLRNSWGEEVGDQGNYYMTYDYFKKFVGEVIEIVEIKQ